MSLYVIESAKMKEHQNMEYDGNKAVITYKKYNQKYLKRVFVLYAKDLISFKFISHLG